MPNLCFIRLDIKGKRVVDFNMKFMGAKNYVGNVFGVNEYSFNNVVPMPENITDESGWSSENWGTRREIYGDVIMHKVSDNQYYYKFATAWFPPLVWLEKASKMFPELEFNLEYAIPLNDSGGECCYQDGRLVSESNDVCCAAKKRLRTVKPRQRKTKVASIC